ncbi:hypothetical protein FHX82_005794 [Amycolatopsis bartoniae]|uniref:Uncharacterized protein n=1 Tax=Amycolatopsis bartoniae TaxID=941986 RepID=A0A8H9J1L7_9PSEU|nr:hypothetical protein [Amycolatopsis bartoniae]MBB2938716.1 hypothetical protein [Amycolatopsis bartoniae]TVT11499.1 hypothetical protein FNH07_01365 [Amycolatopsis bartoniae]GHF79646.1 hypothetical protein GCM10017566_62290 [Amycolatopsis bartoniae]
MRVPVPRWWSALLAASQHLAAADDAFHGDWRARYPPEDFERPDEAEMPRGMRVIHLGEELRSNVDINAAERLRVLTVLDDALGDDSDPDRYATVATFLRVALSRADLDDLRAVWPSLGVRIQQACVLTLDSWPTGPPEWMTTGAPPWGPRAIARLRAWSARDSRSSRGHLMTDPLDVDELHEGAGRPLPWDPPAEAVAAWVDLAEKVRAELDRVGIRATVDVGTFGGGPAGVSVEVNLSMEPHGVLLRWHAPIQDSARYHDILDSQDRSTELTSYVFEAEKILLRAALDVLAAAGFRTMRYYYFPHDRGCAYRVLAPPEHPIT